MSDSLPENSFSGVLRVLKLITGDEIIGLVTDATSEKINISYPACLETYGIKNENDEYIEYVKLTNYVSNIKSYEISMARSAVIYMGTPNTDLEKMYEVYFLTMTTNPKSVPGAGNSSSGAESGLQLLNDLFNNEDFVNFVNDLMDQFEGVESILEIEEEEDLEAVSSLPEEEEPESPPKKRKRKTIKPETNKLPYNPDQPPENPESWSDNPNDYI
jgi:hypothetical protein